MRRPPGVGIVHIPCLQLFLVGQERGGWPLTAPEFRRLRNISPAIEMDFTDMAAFTVRRGCDDPRTHQDYVSRR
ncbi:MAG: hypothetical protein ACRCTD_13965 [Beijerinckiaceae bacterium]